MKFSDIKTIVKAHIDANDFKTMPLISGSPGCGKSALGYELAQEIAFDNVAEINLSMLDTPDVGGLALIGDAGSDVLKFKKSPLMAPLQTGRNLLIMDEFGDASIAMQNVGRRVLWTREINGLKLSPETFIIGMTNRSVDKSGAGKLSGKVRNAVSQFSMESNLDDWTDWALSKGNIDPVLIQFLRFKPNLLDQYSADAETSPTPRQWELVNRVPESLPMHLFFEDVKSKVGEGPAAEYAAFRKIYAALVSFEEVVMNPTTVAIPKDLSAQYAIVGSVAHNVSPTNIERVSKFVERLPSDFGVMFWQDSVKKTPQLKTTKSFIQWATSAGNVVLN
ncbi:MAG: ATP-binding protein [Geobacteraceae bacterium]|nr:ATP-binding protein [Geobacteraceae bacterium]